MTDSQYAWHAIATLLKLAIVAPGVVMGFYAIGALITIYSPILRGFIQ